MERNSKGIAVTVAIVAAIGVSLVAMLAVLNRKDQTVGLNQEIQYDDFAFSVQGVRKMTSLGSGDPQNGAQSVYCVVTLKIANHAKRVDYTFKRASAIRPSSKCHSNSFFFPSPRCISSTRPSANANSDSATKKPSKHLAFYREIIPAMIPIFILGSAVYVSLHLTRNYLSHEKYVQDAEAEIAYLRQEVEALQSQAGPREALTPSTERKRWLGIF